jgi:tetratricopeptide (TPR) repeat protein
MRLLGLLLVLVLAAGCRNSPDCTESQERPVDPVLLAFLSRARAAHHAADLAESQADRPRAINVLREISDGSLPAGQASEAAEVREVLADTLARLADLQSEQGDHDDALRRIDRGLSLVPTPTYFRGHLYEVRGLAEERLAARLQARGDAPGAAAAKERALSALEAAMKLQASVIEQSARTKPGAPSEVKP